MRSVGVGYRVRHLSRAQMFSLSHAHNKLSNWLVFLNIYYRDLMSNLIHYHQKANSVMDACEACH